MAMLSHVAVGVRLRSSLDGACTTLLNPVTGEEMVLPDGVWSIAFDEDEWAILTNAISGEAVFASELLPMRVAGRSGNGEGAALYVHDAADGTTVWLSDILAQYESGYVAFKVVFDMGELDATVKFYRFGRWRCGSRTFAEIRNVQDSRA